MRCLLFAIYAAENGYDTMGSEHLERIGDVKMSFSLLQRRSFLNCTAPKPPLASKGRWQKSLIFDGGDGFEDLPLRRSPQSRLRRASSPYESGEPWAPHPTAKSSQYGEPWGCISDLTGGCCLFTKDIHRKCRNCGQKGEERGNPGGKPGLCTGKSGQDGDFVHR